MKVAPWFLCAALVCGIFAGDARAEWPRINPKLKTGQSAIRSVVILPAQVAYKKIGFKGVPGGTEIGDQFAASLYSIASKELRLRGVDVIPNPLQAAKTDAERYAVADLQIRYDTVAVQIRKKDHRVEHGRMTLDDRVARFAPGAAVDAIVFLRGYGQNWTPIALTRGLGSQDVLAPFLAEVAFVDAKTGEVLMFVRFATGPGVTRKDDDKLALHLRDVLHDVPLPMPTPKSD